MKIGSSSNSQNSFGSFRMILPAEKTERDTFELICREIKKVHPDTKITHEKSQYLPGFVKRLAYSIFNITGKDAEAEEKIATSLSFAGFHLMECEKSAAQRAEAALFALSKPVMMIKDPILDIKA